ncbi:lysine-rich arabinogalactan protein 19-like [Sorghum bicolor]|uniref:lysine-rich arabinogalactan protein 19-like n=1 Tax=Sorghum bicolor TaxID=4558 RepID=UPI000B425739|nr:lysine-rich arabinogalactan protein 19-like [Sorghum bicolor]|eukprot:XP_021315153.1 lysine-rich arabinogalactan protein 19-like [Sorghum bicolor]
MSSSAPTTSVPPTSGIPVTTLPPTTTTSPPPTTTTALLNSSAAGIVPSSPPAAQPIEPTAAAFGNLVAAIYGMQKQISDLSVRMSSMEGRQPSPPQSYPYGLPGYGGIPALPAPGPAISELFAVPPFQPPQHTSTTPTQSSIASPSMTGGVPITQISFPHSPSPIPTMSSIMGSAHPPTQPPTAHYTAAQPYVPEPANPIVPRYQKAGIPHL